MPSASKIGSDSALGFIWQTGQLSYKFYYWFDGRYFNDALITSHDGSVCGGGLDRYI
jgi:hypothetical protein